MTRRSLLSAASAPLVALAAGAVAGRTDHLEIRETLRAFEAVRPTMDRADSQPWWEALCDAVGLAGYAGLIAGGMYYSCASVAEMRDWSDEYGDHRFRAALILDLDRSGGAA